MSPTHVSIWSELWRTGFSLRTIDAGGISTRVLEAGKGPPLVLLHGTGGHLEAYARNIAALAATYRVVAYDMVGHGWSGAPSDACTLHVLDDHLMAVLDVLGIERCHASGESLGGWLAAWSAARHPDRFDRLVLNTPGNVTDNPEVMARIRDTTMAAVRDPSEARVRSRLEWLFHDPSQVTDELVATRQAIYRQPGYERTMEHVLALQDPDIRARYSWRKGWSRDIVQPTLLLWTDNDPTASVADAHDLLALIPGSRLEVISGAGHWPQWERPDAFNDAVLRHLGAVTAGRP